MNFDQSIKHSDLIFVIYFAMIRQMEAAPATGIASELSKKSLTSANLNSYSLLFYYSGYFS